MRSFEFSCIWRESKGLWKCILWNNLCLRQLSKMLCIMFCSFWGTVGSTLMNATSSRAHTVQIIEFKARHLKLPADLTWGIEHSSVWAGANLLHTWFTLFCWSWWLQGGDKWLCYCVHDQLGNLTEWKDSRCIWKVFFSAQNGASKNTGTVGNSGCLAVMLGGNCW